MPGRIPQGGGRGGGGKGRRRGGRRRGWARRARDAWSRLAMPRFHFTGKRRGGGGGRRGGSGGPTPTHPLFPLLPSQRSRDPKARRRGRGSQRRWVCRYPPLVWPSGRGHSPAPPPRGRGPFYCRSHCTTYTFALPAALFFPLPHVFPKGRRRRGGGGGRRRWDGVDSCSHTVLRLRRRIRDTAGIHPMTPLRRPMGKRRR